MKSGLRLLLGAAVIVLAVGPACRLQPRHTGDIDEIRESGQLRVVVRPGFFATPESGDQDLREASLLRHLAGRIGVRVRWIEAARNDRVLEMLVEGLADLAVSRFSPGSLLDEEVRACAAVTWAEDQLIAGPASGVTDFESARGGAVHIHRSAITESLRSFLDEEGLSVEAVPEEAPIEEVLRRVGSGRYSLTVADSAITHAMRAVERMVIVGPVAERRAIVWAVRTRSPRLRLAVDDFLFAEQVLLRATRTTTCRDLERVRQAGVLRLITRNSPTTCTVEQGGLQGFEYDLARSFARSLGVRLELSIPPPEIDPVEWLERGYGDIVALHEPVAPEDEGIFLVSIPYRVVDLVSVVSSRANPPAAVSDLAGVRVAASRSVASICRLVPLRAPMRATVPFPGADAFNAMLEVAHGRVPAAVVDQDAVRLELANRPDLQTGSLVLPGVGLTWLLNSSSPMLHLEVNRFLRSARKSGLVRQLVLNDLGSWRPYVPSSLPPIPANALTPYDELLQWVGRRHEIDWRLLASLMYEESRFDPDAVGPGGSAGLFQFMPFTWRELGVEDPHHPSEAAEAGARYLRRLMDGFEDLPLPDRVAMAIASYNVGPRHVFDARRLAGQMDFDPDRWTGSVETAMLLLDDPEVARAFPAGVCRCRRAVGYTRRILRRYRAYTEQFPPA